MLSLVWCPPGWCCGKLYLVPDPRAWRCPYSGAKARTVVAEFDGLAWSRPGAIRRFFAEQRDHLGHLADAFGSGGWEGLLGSVGQAGVPKPGKRMSDLLGCVVGDPFRPLPPIAPAVLAWGDGIAVKMARGIYDERDFSPERMGVLADALEEAGLDDLDVLSHLRGPGPHARGCHVLDLLLEGREQRATVLTKGPRQDRYWAIPCDAEATGRHVRQTSCPGHFAVVTLRLEIDFGPDAVVFVNGLDERSPVWCVAMDDPAEANRMLGTCWEPFVSEVAEGVKEALAGLSTDGSPIQGLKVSLTGMRVHPVDSRGRDFRQAAILAVTEAVRKAGLVEGPS